MRYHKFDLVISLNRLSDVRKRRFLVKRHPISAKFWDVVFSAFMQIFVFTKNHEYPHLNITMKFSSTFISEDLSFGKVLSSYCFLFYFKPKWAYKLPRSNVLSVKIMS